MKKLIAILIMLFTITAFSYGQVTVTKHTLTGGDEFSFYGGFVDSVLTYTEPIDVSLYDGDNTAFTYYASVYDTGKAILYLQQYSFSANAWANSDTITTTADGWGTKTFTLYSPLWRFIIYIGNVNATSSNISYFDMYFKKVDVVPDSWVRIR